MLTPYPTDMSRWKDWQKPYRYGVFMIVPPDPPFRRIEALRKLCDPVGQAYYGPHISLTVPLPRPLSGAHWLELKKIVSETMPFKIEYGPLMNFLPNPVVYLAVKPFEELDKLRAGLENTAAFRGAVPRAYPFSPHLTIAEYITEEATLEIMEKLKDKVSAGSFLCTRVSYAVPNNFFQFTERGRLDFY